MISLLQQISDWYKYSRSFQNCIEVKQNKHNACTLDTHTLSQIRKRNANFVFLCLFYRSGINIISTSTFLFYQKKENSYKARNKSNVVKNR